MGAAVLGFLRTLVEGAAKLLPFLAAYRAGKTAARAEAMESTDAVRQEQLRAAAERPDSIDDIRRRL